jgi:hypothetical protein
MMRKKLFPRHLSDAPAPFSAEVERILRDLSSTEEKTRAEAVRRLCPCRGLACDVPVQPIIWEMRNDPSPIVRQAVRHDLEENPDWNKRTEARRLEGRKVKRDLAAALREIDDGADSPTPPPHSMAWRTRPRRKTRGRHRLSR